MSYSDARFGFHQPPTDSAIDNKRPAFIDDDDSAILDPSILDPDIMQSPSQPSFRKPSFANSNGVLSPADSQVWDPHQYIGNLPVEPASAGASNPYHDDGNAFMRQSNQQPQGFLQQHQHQHQHQQLPPWSYESGAGECTPTTGPEFMPPPAQFDSNHFQRNDSVHGNFAQPPPHPPQFAIPPSDSTFIPAPQVQTPMSPHSHQDWMGMAQQEMEGRPSHKRMRPDSPPRTVIDFQRRDGIRKKNGRIDIPQERNIQTIDDLIEKTTDDELLKELKQQKRLLRNREAALASRQRKKKHTEDLEVKEKGYTQQIAHLENRLSELSVEREHRERDRQMIMHRLEEANRIIDSMQEEKRDLMMRHNEEASSLRKRVQILSEQIEAGPAPAMSTVPSSAGFTDFNAEMEALNMGPHDWDSFILASDLQNESQDDSFSFDHRPQPVKPAPALEKKASTMTITQESKRSQEASSDQPIASGLLFMLLLCGAFVASKPASSQLSDLPQMPADVRAAAPTVLSNLLSETSSLTASEGRHAMIQMGEEPMPSGIPFGNNNGKASRMDRMHRAITSQTKQQGIDEAFALTSAQYASMTGPNLPIYDQIAPGAGNSAPPARRPLAEALANLENQHPRNSKAEVYTRSLLWDQIPADVVQQFRQIVKDNDEMDARQQQQPRKQQRRPSHELTYKLEH